MYCPSCGQPVDPLEPSCPGCGLDLVETQSGPPPDPSIALVSVFHAGDPGIIAIAGSLLEAEGIEFLLRGDGLQDLFGWGRVGAGYNILTGPAEFVVRETDAQRARELLRDLVAPGPGDDTPARPASGKEQ
jgi:hypothetical protein